MPVPRVRRHKYGAEPTVVDGIRFDSKKEARRYGELRLLEKARKIESLELQPSWPLLVYEHDAVATGACPTCIGTYRADFVYRDVESGCVVVEDVKGIRTAVYRLKKKLVEATYGITIVEV